MTSLRVELGAGSTRREGWMAVDINPAYADIIADIAERLPFADGEVGELRAVDVLEHISFRDTDRVLAEWARICEPGAPLYVQVPDAAEIMRRFIESPMDLMADDRGVVSAMRGAEWRLLGGHADGHYVLDDADWRWNAHYSLWSRETLTDALDRAGFTVTRCVTNPHPNLCCWAERK